MIGVPVLSERIDREVALGDRVLFQTDRTTQAERVLRARAKESMEKSFFGGKVSEDEVLEKYVKKQACAVCTKHFDLFRRPRYFVCVFFLFAKNLVQYVHSMSFDCLRWIDVFASGCSWRKGDFLLVDRILNDDLFANSLAVDRAGLNCAASWRKSPRRSQIEQILRRLPSTLHLATSSCISCKSESRFI
jgi:hypothetical protein